MFLCHVIIAYSTYIVFYKIGIHHMNKRGYERALDNFSQAKDLERSGTEPR